MMLLKKRPLKTLLEVTLAVGAGAFAASLAEDLVDGRAVDEAFGGSSPAEQAGSSAGSLAKQTADDDLDH